MSEFGGWMEMAFKFWCVALAFLALLALALVASYRFFGWLGPLGIFALWWLASEVYEWSQGRRR